MARDCSSSAEHTVGDMKGQHATSFVVAKTKSSLEGKGEEEDVTKARWRGASLEREKIPFSWFPSQPERVGFEISSCSHL